MADNIFSLVLYLFILLWPFVAYHAFYRFFEKNRFALYLICYFPIALAAALRGIAGTDTQNYRTGFDAFDPREGYTLGVDFLYALLMAAVKFAGGEFQAFTMLHAAMCLALYSYGASKIDTAAPVFGLGILPVLFLDATFNGMRYGLAFALATAMVKLYQQRRLYTVPLMLIPAAMHSSMAVLLALSPVVLVVIGVGLFVGGFASSEYFMYFVYKQESYSGFQRPNAFSGAFPLLQFIALWFMLRLGRKNVRFGANFLTLGIVVALGGGFISMFSYAGLRILQIGVFLFGIGTALAIQDDDGRIRTFATILGLAGVVNLARQIFIVGPEGGVFYHPYDFFF